MAAEDTQVAVAAPEEDLSQENLTGASCGKAPMRSPVAPTRLLAGKVRIPRLARLLGLARTKRLSLPALRARRALPAAFRLARPMRRAQVRRRAKAATPPKRNRLSLRPKSVSSRRTMRSPTCSTMFDVNPLIASSLSRAGGLNWGWCLGI